MLMNLKRARKMQIIKATSESIPKDSKHPKNQNFCEFLYTAQNAVTKYKKNNSKIYTRIKYIINFLFNLSNLILIKCK